MTKFANCVPVRTRLPAAAWILAATVALASLATSFVSDGHAAPEPLSAADRGIPQGQDPPGADEGDDPNPWSLPWESLSDQLDRDLGVIAPPPTGDADIHIHIDAPNPDPGTTKVIPPPGTPGGDETIQPK